MARLPLCGQHKATIFALAGKLQYNHTVQTGAIFEAVGAAELTGESQTVQGGTATCFEVSLRPHAA